MRLPGYLVVVDQRPADDGRSMIVTFRIRWWHPGWWLELARALARSGRAGR